jgi:hypothetical protein
VAVDSAEEEGHLHGDQRGVASASGESTASAARRVGEVSDSSRVGKMSDPSKVRSPRCASKSIESKSREVSCRVNKGAEVSGIVCRGSKIG